MLLTTCSNELAPTGAIVVHLDQGAAWPDTLAVAEIASVAVSVMGPDQQAITGLTLVWGSTDSSVVTVTNATAAPGAAPSALVTSRRPGQATIVVRVVQTGFEPDSLRVPVVVRPRGADSLLTVTDTVTVGIAHPPGLLNGATVTWGSSDPSVVNVSAVTGDSTRAVIIGRSSGTAQVTATVQSQIGRSEFQLPVVVRPLEIVEQPLWSGSINLTDSATFAVVVQDALGRPKTGRRVQWRSTNEAAFSVGSLGNVLGKSLGGGELIASAGEPPFQTIEHRRSFRVLQKWSAVSGGPDHTCAIASTDRSAWCWGSNGSGELGNGTITLAQTTLPTRVASLLPFGKIVAGGAHTCGLAANSILCWGANESGQIGDGSPVCRLVTSLCSRPVPFLAIDNGVLGGQSHEVLDVAAGSVHSCAVLQVQTSQQMVCWGGKDEFNSFILSIGSSPQPMFQGHGIAAMASGVEFICFAPDGPLRCAGRNNVGQLGDGATISDSVFTRVGGNNPVFLGGLSAGWEHVCGIGGAGVTCWGSNAAGQLGTAPTPGDSAFSWLPVSFALAGATQVSAGGGHTCALTDANDIYCWGSNSDGQLGNGSSGAGINQTPTLVLGGLKFLSVSAGGVHTCGVTIDGSLYCWGANGSGQLGLGTTTSSSTPVRVGESP